MRRKNHVLTNVLLFTALFCFVAVIHAEEAGSTPADDSTTVVKSKISAVTVFMDKALITRSAALTLAPGDYHLVFDGLPDNIISESIQVEGKGDFLLKQFQYREKTIRDDSGGKKITALRSQIKTLQFRIKEMEDKIQQSNKEMQFIERILEKITKFDPKAKSPNEIDPDKWIKMVSFYRSKLEILLKESREANRQKEDDGDEIDRLESEISNTSESSVTEKYQVEVSVLVKSAGGIRLDLSYLVEEATWMPAYDLRVSTEKKTMTVVYNAVVQQNTSEDWTDAELKFSTAKPNMASKHPDLQRWSVDFNIPPPAVKVAPPPPGAQVVNQQLQQQYQVSNMTNVMNVQGVNLKKEASKLDDEARKRQQEFRSEMERLESEVEDKSISVVFAIPGKNTIKSDNVSHKITIMSREMPVYFRYSAVPKRMKAAFLKARVINTSDYPILPGDYNVFLNNGFITTSRMEFKSPNEEFWTFLGMDEGIKVEYKSKQKTKDNASFLSKKTTDLIYENLVTVTNNKKTNIEIVIWDQLPIPADKEITVELLEPKQIDNTSLKKTDDDFLEWICRLKPGEKLKIPFKFAIRYPKGREIDAK